jgi:hypothetical protein
MHPAIFENIAQKSNASVLSRRKSAEIGREKAALLDGTM